MSRAFRSVAPHVLRLEFHLRDAAMPAEKAQEQETAPTTHESTLQAVQKAAKFPNAPRPNYVPASLSGLARDMVFDNFLRNPTNEFAVAAAQRVAGKFPLSEFNPLVICGSIELVRLICSMLWVIF